MRRAQLGSTDPATDTSLAAHATAGRMPGCLWQHVRPSQSEAGRITGFCLRVITARP